jgi:molybdopterin molybdotransferase
VLAAGRTLRAADIGLIASLICPACASPAVRVAIIATGDELVDVGEPLGPGQIVNSNAYTLAAAVEEAGGEAIVMGIARDRPSSSVRVRRMPSPPTWCCRPVACRSATSTSSRTCLGELGYQERFWKVAPEAGKPLTFGLCGRVPVFGLPGNPVSSLVCFYLYVVPALRTMMGCARVHLPTAAATLVDSVKKAAGLTEFVRCSLEGRRTTIGPARPGRRAPARCARCRSATG